MKTQDCAFGSLVRGMAGVGGQLSVTDTFRHSGIGRRGATALLAVVFLPVLCAMDVTISGPADGSVLVGQTATWTGGASETGNIRYRFRVRHLGADFQMIRDYGPVASLGWAAMRDGAYQFEVSAKNHDSGVTATASQIVNVATRVAGGQPVVNPTDHPLVFLFSAPPCPAEARMRVEFQSAGGPVLFTPFKNCTSAFSMNFYLAGLYAQTTYSAQAILDTGSNIIQGAPLTFQTGVVLPIFWSQRVVQAASVNVSQPILLATTGGSQVATDLNGNVVWFNLSPQSYATRLEPGGFLWGFLEDATQPVEQQGIRMVDLVGHTILETNAARVNEQLAALGKPPISGFHHEVRTLPDGRIAALASEERLVTDLQGPGTVDVLGDMIVVFDRNLQVVWTWDAFDNLDVSRQAVLGETCAGTGLGGCPPFYLATTANDWTHGNSLQQTPDGNMLYSSRHQDWLIKIAYANGEGDGHVIWKLGKNGDFAFLGSDPYPWFSHQHDGNFENPTRLMVFDNGNTRIQANGGGNSRGQVIDLDETNRTATLVLNADLGVISIAVGSAQHLRDGNYHFDAGFVAGPGGASAYAFEVDGSGQVVDALVANVLLYRSIRLTDMYGIN